MTPQASFTSKEAEQIAALKKELEVLKADKKSDKFDSKVFNKDSVDILNEFNSVIDLMHPKALDLLNEANRKNQYLLLVENMKKNSKCVQNLSTFKDKLNSLIAQRSNT